MKGTTVNQEKEPSTVTNGKIPSHTELSKHANTCLGFYFDIHDTYKICIYQYIYQAASVFSNSTFHV